MAINQAPAALVSVFTRGWFSSAPFLAVILMALSARAAQGQTVSWPSVTLTGNHPVESASLHPVAHADSTTRLNMQVTLGLRKRGGLDQLLRDQQNPARLATINGSRRRSSWRDSVLPSKTLRRSCNG